MKPRHLIAALLLVPLGYPLSAGPVGAYYTHSSIRSTAIIDFYDPVFYFLGKMPRFVMKGYVIYLEAWGVDLEKFSVF